MKRKNLPSMPPDFQLTHNEQPGWTSWGWVWRKGALIRTHNGPFDSPTAAAEDAWAIHDSDGADVFGRPVPRRDP